jgi:hypothetical protein
MTSRTAAELAELALTLHRAVAFNDDRTIGDGRGPIYVATRQALRATITTAYPDLDADAVYDVADDGGESIAHAAGYLRERQRSLAAVREAIGK